MKRRPVVIWEGSRPPTRAELRAIANGCKAGSIRSGARVAPVKQNPTPASKAYREFHWGIPSKRKRIVRVPADREVYELGRLRSVDYETKKGRQSGVYRHHFDPPYPILTGTAAGRLGPIVGGKARVTKRGIVG